MWGHQFEDEQFEDRRDAGKRLAEKLKNYSKQSDVVVLGLPRGGVPVAFEVAKRLGLPMDVFVVRKLGTPGHPELAMGAIASGGATHLNEDIIKRLGVSEDEIDSAILEEKREMDRRELLYRGGRKPYHLKGRRVILVDDGLATGASMLAAIAAVKTLSPKEIIVAVPVIASGSISDIASETNNLVYVLSPSRFYAVGQWYREFDQTTDDEVKELLSEADLYFQSKARPSLSIS